MLEDEGHEWGERKEGREEGASLTSCRHDSPWPPAGGSVWFLGIDWRFTLWTQAPWAVSAAAAWVMRIATPGVSWARCAENKWERGQARSLRAQLPLRLAEWPGQVTPLLTRGDGEGGSG